MLETFISSISVFFGAIITYVSNTLYPRILHVLNAPWDNTDMLWMLLPLLATLILMEFYFGRHKDEELGWNTAYGNALVLLFVAIDLFRHLYEPSGLGDIKQFILAFENIKIIIPLAILIMGLILIFIDFFHFLPKKVAYILSSPAYINLIGLLGIIIIYTNIPLDWTTIGACIIIFILANLASLLLYYIVPSYKPPLHRILSVEDVEAYGEKALKNKKI